VNLLSGIWWGLQHPQVWRDCEVSWGWALLSWWTSGVGTSGLISEVKRGLLAQQAQAPLRNHECPSICLVCCGASLRVTAAVVITPPIFS
jgi:hypothetical protein